MDEVGVHRRPQTEEEIWSKELAQPCLQLLSALRLVVTTAAEKAVTSRTNVYATSSSNGSRNFASHQERYVDFIDEAEKTLGRLLQRRP